MSDDYLDLSEPEATETVEEVAPVATEEPAETTAETPEEGAENAEGEEKPKGKPGSQRQKEARIRAEQMAQEANQRAAYLERQLAQIQAQLNPQAPDSEPKIDDFESLEEFVSAKANYVARKQLEQYQYQQLEHQARAANQKQTHDWQTKLNAAIDGKEDAVEAVQEFSYYAQQVGNHAPAVANAVGTYIQESEAGPALVIALGKDPELMQKLAIMSPYKAVAEIGKLEDRILAAKKTPEIKPQTKAPAPPKPLNAIGGAPQRSSGVMEIDY